MGVGILVPVDPTVFLIVAFVFIVGAVCCVTLGESGSEKPKKTKPEVKNHKSRLKIKQVSSINSDYCNECGSYIERGRDHCPHCWGKDITRWESRKTKKTKPEVKNHKSRLKVKKTSNKNKNWCNNCCTYIPKGAEYCPHCGSLDIKKN